MKIKRNNYGYESGFAPIFILIIIVIFVALGVVVLKGSQLIPSNSSAPVAIDSNWNTYTNPLVPVTFKYPANLDVKENVSPGNSGKWILTFTDKDEKYTFSVMSDEDTFEGNKAQIQEQLKEFNNTKLEEVMINGYNALQYYVPPQEDYVIHQFREFHNYITLVDLRGNLIRFQYYSRTQDYLNDYMTILKTAMPQEQVDDWETYSNSEYSFTLDYPASWDVTEGTNTVSLSDKGKVDNKLNISIKPTASPISFSQLNNFVSQNFNIDASSAETVNIQSYPTLRIKNGARQQLFITTGKAVLYIESTGELSNYALSTLSFTAPANVDVLMR